jgi:uncharacterized delta-60 repeat protein
VPHALVEQVDGKLVLLTGCSFSTFAIARLESDGGLDPSFGAGGVVIADPSSMLGYGGGEVEEYDVSIAPDGKIVAFVENSTVPSLLRFEPDGSVDVSYGMSGIVQISVGDLDRAGAILHDPDGRLLVGGTQVSGNNKFALVRLEENGTLDTAFGIGGVVVAGAVPIGGDLRDLARQADGKIIAAGGSGYSAVVGRFLADGAPDACFGDTGFAQVRMSAWGAHAVALMPDGDVVVAAAIPNGTELDLDMAVAQFVAAGGCGVGGTCGDGVLHDGETCDDGNLMTGDGCTSCSVEGGWSCSGQPSLCGRVVEGIGSKLSIINRIPGAKTAKTVFLIRDDLVEKGAGSDPDDIEASLVVSYGDTRGGFRIPAGASDGVAGWRSSTTKGADYLNTDSPEGATRARRVVVAQGRKVKLVGKSIGDVPIYQTASDLDVMTVFTLRNGIERFLYCIVFPASEVTSKFLSGGGTKLIARNGIPVSCP